MWKHQPHQYLEEVTKSLEGLKKELTPSLKKNAKAVEDHLIEIEGQIYAMNQGLAAMGAGPIAGPGASAESAGVPTGTPNPVGPSMPAFPFGGGVPPPVASPGTLERQRR